MQGYAGGGAVAFNKGGNPQEEQDRKRIISALESAGLGVQKLAAAGYDVFTMPVRALAGVYNTLARGPRAFGVGLPFIPKEFGTESMTPMMDVVRARETQPPAVMTSQQMEAAAPGQTAPSYSSGIDEVLAAEKARKATPTVIATRPGTGIAQGQIRSQAAPAAAPADTGLAGLMGPMVEPERLAMRGAVDERQAAIRNAAKTPEDVLKARSGIDALMKEIVDARRAEEQRLMTHSDKRLEEARARAAQSPLTDVSYLGQMLEGMRGSKRFGEALAGAASGAGRAQTARNQALQAAEDKYELSRRDIFNLANLRQQVQLDQAKLAEARATGDADRANKAALDLAQSKEALAKFEMDVSNKSREFGLEERKLAQQAQIAREQMANARKIAETRGAGGLTESQKASLREKASDNVRQDKNLPLLVMNAKKEAQRTGTPFDEQKFIEALVLRQYNLLIGKETPTVPTAGGIDPNILKLFKVTPVGG
jgi:hypothetical protein